MKRLLLTLIAVMPVNAICQTPGSRAPRTFPPKTPGWVSEPAITAADLRQRLFLIADDSMMGRETGSLGAFKASAYVAAEFRRLGLEPAGDSGTYFQKVLFWDVRVDPTSRLVTSSGASLRLCTDFLHVCFDVPSRVFAQETGVYV